MGLLNVLEYAKELIKKSVHIGDNVIDGTCGNGSDTKFLAELVGENGIVYGFDVQAQAIKNTKSKLKKYNLLERVKCINDTHANINKWIKSDIKAAMFNLGYLPGANKDITTLPQSTIIAITAILPLLKKDGIITIIVYTGHDNGVEGKKINEYLITLPQKEYSVMRYDFINQVHNPPYLIAIEKK